MNKLYQYPKTIIAVILLITVFFALQLPKIVVDNDLYAFVGENNPAKIENDAVEAIYGGEEAMVVALESRYSTILTPENIKIIDDLTRQFEQIKFVESVTSLTNADYIEPTAEGMKVSSLIPDELHNDNEAEIIQRLQSWEAMYKKNLYTPDYKSTQIILSIVNELELDSTETIFTKVKAITDNIGSDDLNIYIAGMPSIMVTIKEKIYKDLIELIPIVLMVVILTLYFSFHSTAGVFLPLMNVIISSIWAIGLMAIFNVPFTMISVGIPVILISVGSAYGIHLLSHTYDEMDHEFKDFKELVLKAVNKVGFAVLLAGLTTMAGFGSLVTSSIVPMRKMGIFLAFGVCVAIAVALLMIPAILILRKKPLKNIHKKQGDYAKGPMNRFLLAFYDKITKHNIRNLVFAFIVLVLSIAGTFRIVIDTNMIQTFKEDTIIAQADKFENENFGGTTLLDIVVDGKEDGALLNPEVLKAMDDLVYYLENDVELVGKVISFTEFVKRMNQIMNVPAETAKTDVAITESGFEEENGFSFDDDFGTEEESSFVFEEESNFSFDDTAMEEEPADKVTVTFPKLSSDNALELMEQARAISGKDNLSAEEMLVALKRVTNEDGMAYYETPYDPAKYPVNTRDELKNLIAQYLLLYSGSLDGFIDDPLEPSQSRMVVQIKSPMNNDAIKVGHIITAFAKDRFPEGYEVRVSGSGKLAASMNESVIKSQTSSIISSLTVVFAIVAIYFRSITAGFFGIATLLFSIMANFGVMGFFGIKLDMGTSIVASVAIGIGIDYTIHFLTRYRNEAHLSSDETIITKNTMLTAGKAILFNAIAVGAGFSVMFYSNFIPIKSLGLLIALTMATSSFSALTVLPAMIHTFKPKFIYGKR